MKTKDLRKASTDVSRRFVFFFNYFSFIFLIFFFFWMCWVFCCCAGAFLQLRRAGAALRCSVRAPHWVASLVAEHRLQARGPQQLWHAGSVVVARGLQSSSSVVVAHGLSCSVACGILPDPGSNPCPLHWQADSQPLHHQGRPQEVCSCCCLLIICFIVGKGNKEFGIGTVAQMTNERTKRKG